jgi:hypothetical protein
MQFSSWSHSRGRGEGTEEERIGPTTMNVRLLTILTECDAYVDAKSMLSMSSSELDRAAWPSDVPRCMLKYALHGSGRVVGQAQPVSILQAGSDSRSFQSKRCLDRASINCKVGRCGGIAAWLLRKRQCEIGHGWPGQSGRNMSYRGRLKDSRLSVLLIHERVGLFTIGDTISALRCVHCSA